MSIIQERKDYPEMDNKSVFFFNKVISPVVSKRKATNPNPFYSKLSQKHPNFFNPHSPIIPQKLFGFQRNSPSKKTIDLNKSEISLCKLNVYQNYERDSTIALPPFKCNFKRIDTRSCGQLPLS